MSVKTFLLRVGGRRGSFFLEADFDTIINHVEWNGSECLPGFGEMKLYSVATCQPIPQVACLFCDL